MLEGVSDDGESSGSEYGGGSEAEEDDDLDVLGDLDGEEEDAEDAEEETDREMLAPRSSRAKRPRAPRRARKKASRPRAAAAGDDEAEAEEVALPVGQSALSAAQQTRLRGGGGADDDGAEPQGRCCHAALPLEILHKIEHGVRKADSEEN